jgi:hypothetical protein
MGAVSHIQAGELRSAARFASTCVSIIQLPKRAPCVQRPQLDAPILTSAQAVGIADQVRSGVVALMARGGSSGGAKHP